MASFIFLKNSVESKSCSMSRSNACKNQKQLFANVLQQVFFKVSQVSQENTCAGVLF